MTSTVWSKRSTRAPSVTATHPLPQVLQRPQLQLLHGAFRPAEHRRDLTDTLLLHESHLNHLPLHVRKPVHKLKQDHAALELVELTCVRDICRRIVRISRFLPPTVRNRVRGNPK